MNREPIGQTAAGQPAEPPGADSAQRHAAFAQAVAAARSTTITLDYQRQWGSVANRGGGVADQSVAGPVDVVARMEKFGKPLDRANRVLAECRERFH